MLNKFISKLFEPRHFWRTVGFTELSELYTAQLLRSLGISLIGFFTPIFLYKIGYSLADIAFFHVGWFLVRPALDYVSALVIARIGPKHTMLFSSLVHIFYLGLIMTLQDLKWPLVLVAAAGSFAYSLHVLAVSVDFSKVKHSDHGGKELGYLDIMQKIGGVLGPLAGGLLANYTDPRYSVGLAMIILMISTIPLLLSVEPVRLNQKITFKGLPIRSHIRDYLSVIPATIENTISLIVWPLYAAVFVLGGNTFAKMGVIAAISTGFSLVAIRTIGSIIDSHKGRALMRTSLILNAVIHTVRPFVGGTFGYLGINLANEPVTASYRMPYMKGIYDSADSVPGYRIAYLASMSIVDAVSRLALWLAIWLLLLADINSQHVLQAMFFVAAACSLGIMVERFEALSTKS